MGAWEFAFLRRLETQLLQEPNSRSSELGHGPVVIAREILQVLLRFI